MDHDKFKSLICGAPGPETGRRFAHGGDVRRLAERAGCRVEELTDFSASLNPLGPPAWLERELANTAREVAVYPDAVAREVCLAACELYKVWPDQVAAGNGASELLLGAAQAAFTAGFRRAVIPVPAYADYERVCEASGLVSEFLPLNAEKNFLLDPVSLESSLQYPAVVFLCNPCNPTGAVIESERIRSLAEAHPECRFIVDESFADFVPTMDRLVRMRPDNVIVIHSLTKFYAIPGLRLGVAFGSPELINPLRKLLPEWSVNAAAQRVGARALRDFPYQAETRAKVRGLREKLELALGWLPGIKVFPSSTNFLLCRIERLEQDAVPLAEFLLSKRVAIRLCGNFRGLDDRYFRLAVRTRSENEALVAAMEEYFGVRRATPVITNVRKPAIMLQGTSSNAGKSVLAAALCRILLQDGYSVAPFKSQNMSNNSYVTRDGKEMGRAQVTQSMACRLDPDVRMNPVLLKPGSDIGSQVVVLGESVGNMSVREYVDYKPRAFAKATEAYDSLAEEHDVLVIEGAGSPAEINLKHHDIVNMAMAEHAAAKVLLVGDIDRGGVFASLVGTMDLLTESERDRVAGYILNRFRGDARLLDPAISSMLGMTGKPVMGVIPYIHHLGLPEEDSVSFKAGEVPMDVDKHDECVDIAVVDLAHISNFNDLDPLMMEPDVRVRIVTSPHDIGAPDAVILPGSKNTVADMRQLKGTGMAAALRSLPEKTVLMGICGGFQMLGAEIADPHGLETDSGAVEAFGFLPLRTTLAEDKTLARTTGRHSASGHMVSGYEIHHGVTEPVDPAQVRSTASLNELEAVITGPEAPLGYGLKSGKVWGTYLHGVFDDDRFRRWFVDNLRKGRGLAPLDHTLTAYGLEDALDNLAFVVRENLDMAAVYSAMGLTGGGQASLFR